MGINKNYPIKFLKDDVDLNEYVDNAKVIARGRIMRDIGLLITELIKENPDKKHFSIVCSEDLKKMNIIVWDGYIEVICPYCSKEYFKVPNKTGIAVIRCSIHKNFIGTLGRKAVLEISENGHVDIRTGF